MFELSKVLALLVMRGELPHERVGSLGDLACTVLAVGLGQGSVGSKEDDVHVVALSKMYDVQTCAYT
jgi:hypothetical protein